MVYHYTTIEAFYSILTSYKEAKDEKYFTFWASNVLNQNDKKELSFKSEDLHNIILKVEEEKAKKGKHLNAKKMSNAINWHDFLGRTQKEILNEIDSHIMENYTPFSLSFSHQKDKLLMWSIYGNSGNGLCLVFNEKELFPNTEMTYLSKNVWYNFDGKNINNSLIYDVVSLIYDEYLRSLENDEYILINSVMYKGEIFYKMMLESISPFIKHTAFKEEKEWRILFLKNKNTHVFTKITRNLNTVQYVKIGIPISALKRIIIGPCAQDKKGVIDLLRKEASSCGIKKLTKPEFYISSEVPYRHF